MARLAILVAALLIACGDPDVGSVEQAATSCVDLPASADAFVSNPPMHQNYGDKKILRAGGKDESLIRFELGAIPSSAVVSRATVKLYISDSEATSSVFMHRVTSAWTEDTVTYASLAQRFDPAPAGTLEVTADRVQKSADVTGAVARWIDGTYPNDGFLLEVSGARKTTFVSREGAISAERPVLQVCYSLPIDHCAPEPCANGGTCENTSSGFACHCAAGFLGETCETPIDNCADQPCKNGATCQSGPDGYTCTCSTGYSGTNCEIEIDECAAQPCQNGGVCEDGIGSYLCHCPPGYAGSSCETEIDHCEAAPCQNGGTCTNRIDGYVCQCPSGFAGANCEIDVDDCANAPCHNGGTCIDAIDSFTCSCPPDRGGPTCDVNLDSCAQNPCLHGSCTNGVGDYTCACSAGYSGTNCEIDVNDCTASACANGGVCVDGVNSFTCACPAGFAGPRCEIDIDDCSPNPCLHGGTCIDGVNQHACECGGDFQGPNCEVETPETIVLSGVVRDFHAGAFEIPSSHWDFFNLITTVLANHVPRDYPFFQDTPQNARTVHSVVLSNAGQSDPSVFAMASDAFYPLDGRLFGNEGSLHNDYFSYEIHTALEYVPGTVLGFASGDALIVVAINGVLVPPDHIDLDALAAAHGLVAGSAFPLDIFYMHDTGVPSLRMSIRRPACSSRNVPMLRAVESTRDFGAVTRASDYWGEFIRLTPPAHAAAAVWRDTSFPWQQGFRVELLYRSTTRTSAAIVFAAAPGVGGGAENLGYIGLGPSLAIEFDTEQDTQFSDPVAHHVSIHTRGAQANCGSEATCSIGSVVFEQPRDTLGLGFAIEYEPVPGQPFGWLRVYLDNDIAHTQRGVNPNIPVLAVQIPTSTLLGALGDSGEAYVGVTTSDRQPPRVCAPGQPCDPLPPIVEVKVQNWHVAAFEATTAFAPTSGPSPIQVGAGSYTFASEDARGASLPGGEAACYAATLRQGALETRTAIADNLDGTYRVSYAPPRAGDWTLGVRLQDHEIFASPFTLTVGAGTGAPGPSVAIDSGPAQQARVGSHAIAVAFSTTTPGATFECSFDRAPLVACGATAAASLADGIHTFGVRAIDPVCNVGTELIRTFHVDTTGPSLSVRTLDAPVGTGDATLTFASDEPVASFAVALDGHPAATAVFPVVAFSELSPGAHHVVATSTDAVGNASSSAYDFTIDTGTGHLVWIGHDTSNATIDLVLGNAAALARASSFSRPLAVLGYHGAGASVFAQDRVLQGLTARLASLHINPLYSEIGNPAALDVALVGTDVVLVFDPPGSFASATLGNAIGPSLNAFLARGGVVILMAGSPSDLFAQGAGLLALSGGVPISSGTLVSPTSAGASHPLARDAVSYSAFPNTVGITTPDPAAVSVFATVDGRVVVLEKPF